MGSGNSRENSTKKLNLDENRETLTREVKQYIDDNFHTLKLEFSLKKRSLKTELEQLKSENAELRKKYEDLTRMHHEVFQKELNVKEVSSKISDDAIDRYVADYLNDPNVNHGYFIEAMEGAVYRRALKSVLHALAATVDTASIQFVGHKIVFGIEPISKEESISDAADREGL